MPFPPGMKMYKLVHCSMVDGKVVPSDNDPQIYFKGLEGEINNVLITLREETTARSTISCFIRTSRALSHIRAV